MFKTAKGSIPENKAAYYTHLNYARCMEQLLEGLHFSMNVQKSQQCSIRDCSRFYKLATLTKKSIDGEIEGCREQSEYIRVVAPWFAVKCYYRAYYLESIIINLVSGSIRPFSNGGHVFVRKTFRQYCKEGLISTDLGRAEIVESVESAMNYRVKSGQNLQSDFYSTEECSKAIRSKLAKYAESHWKFNSKHDNFRKKVAKNELNSYKKKTEVSAFDFLYYMRIKSNYKDLDFLNFDDMSDKENIEYVESIYSIANKYCDSLKGEIQSLYKQRFPLK